MMNSQARATVSKTKRGFAKGEFTEKTRILFRAVLARSRRGKLRRKKGATPLGSVWRPRPSESARLPQGSTTATPWGGGE